MGTVFPRPPPTPMPTVPSPPVMPVPIALVPVAPSPVKKPPTRAPTKAPAKVPVPVKLPTKAPVKLPVPVKPPTKAPTKAPIKPPTKVPTKAPVKPPTKAPVKPPTKAPVKLPTKAPIDPNAPPAIRINAGGVAYTDVDGQAWLADQYFMNGSPYNAGLETALPPNGVLYSTERYFNIWVHPQPFLYEIPVPAPGEYAAVLHFMETFFQTAGSRVFDVWVEGQLFLNNLDIVAEVGYRKLLVVHRTTMVKDGSLTVEFVAQVENPKISALEVIHASQFDPPTGAPTTSPAPSAAPSTSPAPTVRPAWKNIYINCGGPKYLSNDGLIEWRADTFFTGGGVYVDGSHDITPTADDAIFHSERHGTFTYNIPVPVGNYEITVHLAEL
jgi:hypothetical protein